MEQHIVRAVIQDVLINGNIAPGTRLLLENKNKDLYAVNFWLYERCNTPCFPNAAYPIDKIRLYLADPAVRRYIFYATGITTLPPFDPADSGNTGDRAKLLSIAVKIGNYRDAWKLLQGRHLLKAKVDFHSAMRCRDFDMIKLLCRYGVVSPFNVIQMVIHEAPRGLDRDQGRDAYYDLVKYLLSAKWIRGLSDLLYLAYSRGRIDMVEAILATKPKNVEIALDHAVQAGNLAAIEYFYAITGQFTHRQVKMAGLGGKKEVILRIQQSREIILDRLLIDVINNIGTHIQLFYGQIPLNLKLLEPIYNLVDIGASKFLCLQAVERYPLITSIVAERLATH